MWFMRGSKSWVGGCAPSPPVLALERMINVARSMGSGVFGARGCVFEPHASCIAAVKPTSQQHLEAPEGPAYRRTDSVRLGRGGDAEMHLRRSRHPGLARPYLQIGYVSLRAGHTMPAVCSSLDRHPHRTKGLSHVGCCRRQDSME